jgi:hypothetical protein
MFDMYKYYPENIIMQVLPFLGIVMFSVMAYVSFHEELLEIEE